MPDLCNGKDPAVIANKSCTFPMRLLKNNGFYSGSSIYVTVSACNLNGCSEKSPNNLGNAVAQWEPDFSLQISMGKLNNLTFTSLKW
jgi:hypothetical protein